MNGNRSSGRTGGHEGPALRAPWRLNTRLRPETALWVALLIAPLAIGLGWGTHLDDGAYPAFCHARDLVAGRGLTYSLAAGPAALPRSPLYVLALLLPAWAGIPLPWAGLVLSAVGWGVATLAVYSAARAVRRPVGAVVSATLVAFSPLVTSTLGTGIPWTAALAWIAVASAAKKRWGLQAAAVVLMLCSHFDLSTLALAVLLALVQWVAARRFPLRLGLILAIAALGWGLLAACHVVAPFTPPDPNPIKWEHDVRQLLDESEFYWLFLPPVGVGLFVALRAAPARRPLWLGLPGVVILAASAGAVSEALLATLGVFLAGLGIDAASPLIVGWIETHNVARLKRSALAAGLALLAGLPLGLAQASSLWQRYQFRPFIRQEIEEQAASWLRAHSEPTAVVLGSARIGYLADRPALPWDGRDGEQAELANLLKAMNENPPGYCVSYNTLTWSHLVQTRWFRDRYTLLEEFGSPYDGAASSVAIWGYLAGEFDEGEQRPLNVRLPGRVNLVGYRSWPSRIQPGDPVYVTLFLQATQPVTDPFQIVVEIVSPNDAIARGNTSHPVQTEWWQTGQVVAERVVVPTAADTPIGAHHVDVYAMTAKLRDRLPVYRDDDAAPLDRVTLGYVVVPWRGETSLANPVGANLADQISLLSFEAPDSLSPGAAFDVTLYWEALRPPEDDYVVFVHLIDADGQLAAGHDGPPMDRRYATRAWIPGEVVPDVHHIVLDPETPVGTYQLKAGMYRWPSLERLPAWDSQGDEQPDRAVVLQSVEVR